MNNGTTLKPRLTQLQLIALYDDLLRKKHREKRRSDYARNRERLLAQGRTRRAADPERARQREAEYREKNPLQAAGYVSDFRHGSSFKVWRAAMWRAQDGLCYLCERELGPELMAVVEHDHRCCPDGKSCEVCRRGLACGPCNSLIGFAGDDPDRLETIARNLRTARATVTARLAGHES